jgi:hypothetical protein
MKNNKKYPTNVGAKRIAGYKDLEKKNSSKKHHSRKRVAGK